MREKESYRDNLAMVLERFPDKRIISIREAAEFLGVPSQQLSKDARLRNMMITYGKQKRLSITALARWMS